MVPLFHRIHDVPNTPQASAKKSFGAPTLIPEKAQNFKAWSLWMRSYVELSCVLNIVYSYNLIYSLHKKIEQLFLHVSSWFYYIYIYIYIMYIYIYYIYYIYTLYVDLLNLRIGRLKRAR